VSANSADRGAGDKLDFEVAQLARTPRGLDRRAKIVLGERAAEAYGRAFGCQVTALAI
jgi:hypothetical protein